MQLPMEVLVTALAVVAIYVVAVSGKWRRVLASAARDERGVAEGTGTGLLAVAALAIVGIIIAVIMIVINNARDDIESQGNMRSAAARAAEIADTQDACDDIEDLFSTDRDSIETTWAATTTTCTVDDP